MSRSSSRSPREEPPPIEAKTIANMAMTDNMTIGTEQVVVSLSLLGISLYFLAKPASKLKWRQFIQYILSGGRFTHNHYADVQANDNHERNKDGPRPLRMERIHAKPDFYKNADVNIETRIDADAGNANDDDTDTGADAGDDGDVSSNVNARSDRRNNRLKPAPHVRFYSPQAPASPTQKRTRTRSPLRKVRSTSSFVKNDSSRSLGIGDWQSNSTSTGNSNIDASNAADSIVTDYYVPEPSPFDHPKDLEYEHFLQTYETLLTSRHRRLVLPPQCRLIDPVKMRMFQKQQENRRRLANFQDSLRRIYTFDYMGMMYQFNYRVMAAFITRWCKGTRRGEDADEDDDLTVENVEHENDDGTESSVTSQRSNFDGDGVDSNNNASSRQSSPSLHAMPHGSRSGSGSSRTLNPNKKGMNMTATRQESQDRFFSTVSNSVSGDIEDDFKDTSSQTMTEWEDEKSVDPPTQPDRSRSTLLPSPSLSSSEISFLTGVGGKKEDSQREEEIVQEDEMSELDLGSCIRPSISEIGEASVSNDALGDRKLSLVDKPRAISPLHHDISPTNAKRPTLSKLSNTNKVKDQLEKYRRGSGGPHHNPAATSNTKNNSTNINNAVPKTSIITNSSSVNTAPPLEALPDSNLSKLSIKSAEFYFDAAAHNIDEEGYILGDDLLADTRDTPLLVFVNSRSGSQQGLMLKTQLRRLLNPIQVWDLADGGPEKVLKSFSVLTHLRLLVCGGDGTVNWIISALDKMQIERWPPIAILPLGTGNDLARIHGWGGGYANESLLLILNQVQEAYTSLLDRWKMEIEVKKKKRIVKEVTNYMSIGMDAQSALQVHNLRENSPTLFFSRAVNLFIYGLFGVEDVVKASFTHLPKNIKLIADGVEVPIPDDSQALIILNIDSYAGGVPLWSHGVPAYNTGFRRLLKRRYSDSDFPTYESDAFPLQKEEKESLSGDSKSTDDIQTMGEKYAAMEEKEKLASITACDMPSSCQDGRLDVISVRGNFHLGQIKVGISNSQRLCQCRELKIILKKKTAVQVDGEPWEQDKGTLKIMRKKDPAIMLHRATEEGGGVETEVAKLLNWAEEKKIINHAAHGTLMKEFSRRIESKTRARRVKSQSTVFSTMTRAITSNNNLSKYTNVG